MRRSAQDFLALFRASKLREWVTRNIVCEGTYWCSDVAHLERFTTVLFLKLISEPH